MTAPARDELLEARIALCDLLIGRECRAHATEQLYQALTLEAYGHTAAAAITGLLERAAHWEWMASISERGLVLWGERNNRCGLSPPPEDF